MQSRDTLLSQSNINSVDFFCESKKTRIVKPNFWDYNSMTIDEFSTKTPQYEGQLYFFRKKLKAYVKYNFKLFNNTLAYKKNDKLCGCRVLTFEILNRSQVTGSINYSHCLVFTAGKFNKFLYSNDKTSINIWYQELKRWCFQTCFFQDYDIISDKESHNPHQKLIKIQNKFKKTYYEALVISIEELKSNPSVKSRFLSQVEILRELDNPFLPHYEGVYIGDENVYLITDYINGKTLSYIMNTKGMYKSVYAAELIKNLLKALICLEERQIIHRNIIPDNIIIDEDNDHTNFKLIGFETAVKIKNIDLKEPCGTIGFIAPEILYGKYYDCKSDVFSAGLVFYYILSGRLAFEAETLEDLLQQNSKCEIEFPLENWSPVNNAAIDLIKHMTNSNPKNRYNPSECLKSELFTKKFTAYRTLMHLESSEYMSKFSLSTTAITNPDYFKLSAPTRMYDSKILNYSRTDTPDCYVDETETIPNFSMLQTGAYNLNPKSKKFQNFKEFYQLEF